MLDIKSEIGFIDSQKRGLWICRSSIQIEREKKSFQIKCINIVQCTKHVLEMSYCVCNGSLIWIFGKLFHKASMIKMENLASICSIIFHNGETPLIFCYLIFCRPLEMPKQFTMIIPVGLESSSRSTTKKMEWSMGKKFFIVYRSSN